MTPLFAHRLSVQLRRWLSRLGLSRPGRSRYRVSKSSEAGYNLVVLAVAITVLNIMVAKALPVWSHQIQREKEAELIFRGLQYAEAIRIFEIRNQGRLPTKLEQLIEIKPRCIRQLWKNPMSEDGKWGLIFAGQGRNLNQQQGRNLNRQQGRDQQQGGRAGFDIPRDGDEVGPIIGVYSPDGGEAIRVFAPPRGGGGGDISDWRFTKALFEGLGGRSVATGDGLVQTLIVNAGDIGKPWPPGIHPPRSQGQGIVPGQRGGRGIGVPGQRGGRGIGVTGQQGSGAKPRQGGKQGRGSQKGSGRGGA